MSLPRTAARPLAVALLALAVAAPAWSALEPPPARSFSVAVEPGVPAEPGKRFNLVGLTWRGPASARVALRVRSDGRWGPWRAVVRADAPQAERDEAPRTRRVVTDPLWVGEADAVEVRADRRLRGLRAVFENTTGTATAADRARTALAGAARAGLALLGVGEARAADEAPRIIPREEWERGQCEPREKPVEGVVRAAFVHHSVGGNSYSRSESKDVLLAYCRYHRNTQGWNDLGYNFAVDRFGQVFEGREGGIDRAIVGAHAQGWNAQSTGIVVLGTYSSARIPEAAMAALSRLVAWKLALHGVRPGETVVLTSAGGEANRYPKGRRVRFHTISGHRDGDRTECPGDALYAQLPELRERAARFDFPLQATGSGPPLEASRAAVAYRGRVELRGRALAPGARVRIERDGGGWHAVETVQAGPDASFAASFRARETHRYRAVEAGQAGPETRVQVRPRLTTLLRGATRVARTSYRARPGARLRFSARVTPMKRRVVVRAERQVAGEAWRTAVREVVRTRRGRARVTLRLTRPGTYRIRALSFGDAEHASGRSHVRTVEVAR
jgi:hypothetical protein